MNTVQKGDNFEDLVYNLFKDMLEKDESIVNKKHSEIFKKKKYYSPKREKDIIFDIAIEVYHPNTKHISLICIIECKDYSHAVTVDDIEEFYSKVRQVTDLNVKAFFITSNILQKAAMSFAKNSNIAVARILSNEQVKWLNYNMSFEQYQALERKQNSINYVTNAMTSSNFIAENRNFFGILENQTFDNLNNLFLKIIDI